MKIYILSYNTFSQNRAGGVKTKVIQHINNLNSKGILCKYYHSDVDDLSDCDALHCFALKLEFYELIQYARAKGIKVILSAIATKSNYYKIWICLILSKLFHIHTIYSVYREMLQLSNIIITETEDEKLFLQKAYKIESNKIIVIPNGVSSDVVGGDPALIKYKYGIHQDIVLQIGRFDKNKNQLSVVKAMQGTNIPIVFIGGPSPDELEYYELCKKEATSNMYFLGWLNHDDPMFASALAAAKVVVLPSFKEIFGNAIFEGISCNSNIAVTNSLPIHKWGFDEFVETFCPSKLDEIRNAIEKAYSSDINQSFCEKVRNDYSWSTIAEKFISIYKQL